MILSPPFESLLIYGYGFSFLIIRSVVPNIPDIFGVPPISGVPLFPFKWASPLTQRILHGIYFQPIGFRLS